VKKDVSFGETIETTHDGLDETAFLSEMEEEIKGVTTLKEAAGIGTLLPHEAKGEGGDVYTRAVAKMEAMARDSINKHMAEMEAFNNEIDVATKRELNAEARKNGPIIAFSFLALAIGGGMVATAPEAMNGIDLSTAVGGLPALDLSGINIELPMPQVDLSDIGANIDVSAMTTAISNTKDALLAQADSFTASFPTVVDEMTSQAHEGVKFVSNQLRGSLDPILSRAELISDNIVGQANEIRDIALPTAQSSIVAQADALRANIPPVDEIQNAVSAYGHNLQYFVSSLVDGQIGYIQDSLNDAQLSLGSYPKNFLREMTQFQSAAIDKIGETQHASIDQMEALQETIQAKIMSIDVDSIAAQAQVKAGTDALMQHAGSSFANANELIQTQVSHAKTYGSAVVDDATVALRSVDMPNIDASSFVARAKNIQEAFPLQIADIELPTSIDVSSLKEAAEKSAESLTDNIAPILQQNLGIPL